MEADFKVDSDNEIILESNIDNIGDFLEFCQHQENLNNISLLLYMILRHFNIRS